jgi:hypothetical protein
MKCKVTNEKLSAAINNTNKMKNRDAQNDLRDE